MVPDRAKLPCGMLLGLYAVILGIAEWGDTYGYPFDHRFAHKALPIVLWGPIAIGAFAGLIYGVVKEHRNWGSVFRSGVSAEEVFSYMVGGVAIAFAIVVGTALVVLTIGSLIEFAVTA